MLQMLLTLIVFLLTGLLFAGEATVFVAPSGNNTNDGLSEINAVATIDKGLEIVRTKNIKNLSIKGKHRIETPIVLTPKDSGLTVTGHGIIDGSRIITGWKPYKNGIWQAEIPEVKEGKWYFRQIYVGGEFRQRAKTPNEGFYCVAACPEGTPKTTGYSIHCQSFEFKPDDINPNWKNINDIEVIVYYFWNDNHLPIESIDTEKHIVRFKHKSCKTFTDGHSEDGARYIVENVFEALDQPGEWYLDKVAGIVYYMPKEGENLNKIEVVAPFAKELLRFDGKPADNNFVSNVKLQNISFQYCHFELPPGKVNSLQDSSEVVAAVNLTGVKNCTFTECLFSNFGTFGMELKSGCSAVNIIGCRFENLAAGGIRINGGEADSNPLTHTKNNVLLQNEIVNYGQIYPSAVGIIAQHSYGNNISRNHIHHGYYTGISLGWVWGYGRSISQDNIVEHNHIHHIGQGLLSDMGAVYTVGPSPGTIIRNNLIHDIDAHQYGGWGIYNDEGSAGIHVENNIVYNTKFACYDMHFGKEITIRNNIFAMGRKDQISRTRGEKHPSFYFENNIIYWKEGILFTGDWKDKEYKYYTHPYHGETDQKRNFESNWNVFYNPNLKPEEVQFDGGSFDDWKKRGYDNNSIYADPMFIDSEHFDFRLKPESPALKLGFEEIDLRLVPGQ